MHYRHLGDSGMKVSTISLGGWINYGEGKVESDIARQVVETAYDQGINFFDLADIYGKGEAEKQMGDDADEEKLADKELRPKAALFCGTRLGRCRRGRGGRGGSIFRPSLIRRTN